MKIRGRLLSLRVALRYLSAPKSHSAVNTISYISVAGVAVATLAIVCVLSVFNGFTDVALQRLSVFDPALKVTPSAGKIIESPDSLAGLLSQLSSNGIATVTPVVEEHALAIYDDRQLTVRFRGVGEDYDRVTPVGDVMIDGEFLPSEDIHGHALASVGVGVALSLGAHPGYYDWLRLYVPRRIGRINPANPLAAFRGDSLVVSGVFQLNQTEYDNDMVIVPIEVARRLLDMPGQATALEIALTPGTDPAAAARTVSRVLGGDYTVATRMQQQDSTYRMIEVEKWVTMLLLVFILVIASFNILSTLSMLIIEKRSDITTYRSLGATRGFIGSIFMSQGFIITVTGALAGMVAGVALCLLQQKFGFIRLGGDPSQLSITAYPVKVEWGDLLIVGLITAGVGAGIGLVARLISTAGLVGRARAAALILSGVLAALPIGAKTPIQGDADVDPYHLCCFVRQHNAEFPIEIAEVYVDVCHRYGIRADIAFCQAIIETGWFKFGGGTAVTIEQNNFCGLGVTRLGMRGVEFSTVEEGVTAQIQHLFAYACHHKIPDGEQLLDPRFALVKRGCAPHWEDLSGRWAANSNYARNILDLHRKLMAFVPPPQEERSLEGTDEDQDTDDHGHLSHEFFD